MQFLIVVAICSVFVFAGLFMCFTGLNNILTARESVYWKPANGKITFSEIEENSDSDGPTYKPSVRYSYKINGREYSGSTIYIGDGNSSTNDRSYARRFVEKYPLEKEVIVYCKPDDPKRSTLEPGLMKASFILFTFGVGFAFMGLWTIFLFWLYQP